MRAPRSNGFLLIHINEFDFIQSIWIPLFIMPITKIVVIIYCVCQCVSVDCSILWIDSV